LGGYTNYISNFTQRYGEHKKFYKKNLVILLTKGRLWRESQASGDLEAARRSTWVNRSETGRRWVLYRINITLFFTSKLRAASSCSTLSHNLWRCVCKCLNSWWCSNLCPQVWTVSRIHLHAKLG